VVDDDLDDDEEPGSLGDFVRKAMTIKVHPDLMRKAMRAYANMAPEDRGDLTMQMLSTTKIVEALKRVKKRDRSALAHALHLRMTALARLSGRPEFNGYATGKTKDGAVYIRDEMIVAAASAPLTAKDERTIEFDPDVIFQLLLKDGRHDGRA
jgi:hypothetical protein